MKNVILNSKQRAAAEHASSRLLVIAGAGSGKTSTYIQRIRHLLRNGARPENIVAITFTNAAANEINQRLNSGDPVKLGYIGTLHGFILRQLQKYGVCIGLARRLTVLDEEEAAALLARCIKRINYRGPVAAVEQAVKKGVGYYRGKGWKRTEVEELVAYEFYFQLMTTGCLTFDSILELGLELVKSTDWKQCPKGYDHLLVDEYQDSSPMDAQIYDALTVVTRFFVGDPDQSIYGFRGGNVGIILAEATNPATTLLTLDANYRSGPVIVGAANELISHNKNRIPKLMVAAGDTQHDQVEKICFPAAGIETAMVCKSVVDITYVLPPEQVAILCRTNWHAAEFRTALVNMGVKVQAKAKTTLPPDWALARACVALFTNPENDGIAGRFLTLLKGPTLAEEMCRKASDSFQSVNERWLHIANMQVADVTTAMSQVGIGRESIARVAEVVAGLPAEATVLELQFALAQKEQVTPEQGSGVVVTTIHSAKGREWDNVFLPGWEQGMFPMKQATDIEEERRLAFVGITRARKFCCITMAEKRTMQWVKEPVSQKPSPFYNEVSV
jgi:DNA helicase-2/ATP-dependent DNA helicase PcrA